MTGERVMDAGDHETALADQMVLSHCDYIVSTRESTMGFVAHAATYKVFFFFTSRPRRFTYNVFFTYFTSLINYFTKCTHVTHCPH